ncbi:MAG: hypothetical protein A4E53_01317 [Pelotomaculum sp. PtaB.Bin104]|nr:MAG: hypothetical protein A4E53_01317 [Pelotomaculum sp. PtaB.Bin104]
MNELDSLIKEKLVPIRKKAVDTLTERNPNIFSVVNHYLSKNNNRVGLRVTENGKTVGEYTFHLDGLQITNVESGVLSSEIHHPFGVIKPYGIIEKSVLEKMLEDEQDLIDQPFSAIRKYMPDITIKFMR